MNLSLSQSFSVCFAVTIDGRIGQTNGCSFQPRVLVQRCIDWKTVRSIGFRVSHIDVVHLPSVILSAFVPQIKLSDIFQRFSGIDNEVI